MLKKNPNERISLFQMKNYYSLQEAIYCQYLNKTLANIMERKEEDFIENIFSENLTREICFIMKQIQTKDKVTDLCQCVNYLNYFLHESNSIEKIKSTPYEKEDQQFIIRRKILSSKTLKQANIQDYSQANIKKGSSKQYSNQKRSHSFVHSNRRIIIRPF
jgi:hypothetical protein